MVNKDLIVSVSTNESGIDVTLRTTRILLGHVLLQHEGVKVALNINELREALTVLDDFIKTNYSNQEEQ